MGLTYFIVFFLFAASASSSTALPSHCLIDGAPGGGDTQLSEVINPNPMDKLGEVQCCHDTHGCTRRNPVDSSSPDDCISGHNDATKYNLQEAIDMCDALGDGWRLCTREEVDQDLCRSKGCSIDAQLVWALDPPEKQIVPITFPSDICGVAQATISSAEWYDCNTPITVDQCFETCLNTDGCVAFQVTKMDETAWAGNGNCAETGERAYKCTPQSSCRVDSNHRWEFYRVVDMLCGLPDAASEGYSFGSSPAIDQCAPEDCGSAEMTDVFCADGYRGMPATSGCTADALQVVLTGCTPIPQKQIVPISWPSDICGTAQATISSAEWYDCNTPITVQQCFETCLNTEGCEAFQVTKMDETAWAGNGNCEETGERAYKCTPQSSCRVDTNHRWEFYRLEDIPASGECDLPRGDFAVSCHSCQMENCILTCDCGMGETTLNLKRRCRGQEVMNLGGALACPIINQGSDLLDLHLPKGEAEELLGFQEECVSEDLLRSNIENSQCVTKTEVFNPTTKATESEFNGFLWSFGQFVDHDTGFVLENHDNPVYAEGHFFDVSVGDCEAEGMLGNRKNSISSRLDLSSVYGQQDTKPEIRSEADRALLAMPNDNEMPVDADGHYICGDDRCNENPFLTSQHTLWVKHHNIIVGELDRTLSSQERQDREQVYAMAKQINVATYQNVLMNEFVPTLVGNLDGEYAYQGHINSYELMAQNSQCRNGVWLPLGDNKVTPQLCMHLITSLAQDCHGGYMSTSTSSGGCFCVTSQECELESAPGVDTYMVGPQHDMSMSPLFTGAAYRLHQLVQDTFELAPGQEDFLSSHFGKPESYRDWGKIDGWFDRLMNTKSNRFGSHMADSLKHHLFCTDPSSECQNLAARNCMRGLDLNLPTLNEARELFGLRPYDSLEALFDNCPILPHLYESIDDVELFIGGSCENPVAGAVLGETFLHIVKDQFVRLRDGDPSFGLDHPVGGTYRNLREVLEIATSIDRSSFNQNNIFLFED